MTKTRNSLRLLNRKTDTQDVFKFYLFNSVYIGCKRKTDTQDVFKFYYMIIVTMIVLCKTDTQDDVSI